MVPAVLALAVMGAPAPYSQDADASLRIALHLESQGKPFAALQALEDLLVEHPGHAIAAEHRARLRAAIGLPTGAPAPASPPAPAGPQGMDPVAKRGLQATAAGAAGGGAAAVVGGTVFMAVFVLALVPAFFSAVVDNDPSGVDSAFPRALGAALAVGVPVGLLIGFGAWKAVDIAVPERQPPPPPRQPAPYAPQTTMGALRWSF